MTIDKHKKISLIMLDFYWAKSGPQGSHKKKIGSIVELFQSCSNSAATQSYYSRFSILNVTHDRSFSKLGVLKEKFINYICQSGLEYWSLNVST